MRPRSGRLLGPAVWTLSAVLFCTAAEVLPAQTTRGGGQTQTIQVGEQILQRRSQATRSEMFGLVDLYEVGLYAPVEVSDLEALRRPDTPKALQVNVLYDGSLPNRIPEGWRSELGPALDEAETRKLRSAYAKLGPMDEIRIVYAPGLGTTIRVSGHEVLTGGHDIMAAFLNIWLGQTPVSDDVKQELLDGL